MGGDEDVARRQLVRTAALDRQFATVREKWAYTDILVGEAVYLMRSELPCQDELICEHVGLEQGRELRRASQVDAK